MKIEEYLNLMHVPKEWTEWNMLPEESYLEELISTYEPGMEDASEHDRNGFFHWWLKKEPTEEQLLKLAKLTNLDPDDSMSKDVQSYIIKANNCSNKVAAILKKI